MHYSPSAISYEAINTLAVLSEEVNINVTYIDSVPVWSEHIPYMMYQSLKYQRVGLIQTKQDYLAKNTLFHSDLERISTKNFKRVSIVDYFCQPECSYKSVDGTPLYYDSGHLTLTGSYLLRNLFTQLVNELSVSRNLTNKDKSREAATYPIVGSAQ